MARKKKQLTNYEKVKKLVSSGLTTAQKGVSAAGRRFDKIGQGLSASGETIGKSFGAPNSQVKERIVYVDRPVPQPQEKIVYVPQPQKVVYVNRLVKTKPKAKNLYTPKGYKKTLEFGWGGY